MKKIFSYCLFLLLNTFLIFCFLFGEENSKKEARILSDESLLGGLKWRCIGPANMGGRINDIAVAENNPHIVYVGTASGGVWKTTNNGVTWEPIFDGQSTSSIGDIAVASFSPDIVWVGTGEPNNRQSSSWGNGVYKSTDGGKTWKNMGLCDTHHIGRIIVHPTNPDIVYVAALGHLWGPNKERGLYRTVDGGKTWVNTKVTDENTGFVDVAIDPENPHILYAAAYQRRRRGWGFNGGGPGSGLYKTTDGGETWVRLSNGLPTGNIGRIGIDIYRSDPNVVYAIIEHKHGGVFRSEDKGLSWNKMSDTNPRPMYYSQIRIDPNNDQRIWVLAGSMHVSDDGGKTFRTDLIIRYPRRERRVHSDQHALWINPADSNHMILGNDGGIYISYDRGKSWDFNDTLPLGQFYEIGFDMRKPYHVFGGLQDNGCWSGPSASWKRLGITNEDWFKFGGGDGFYTQMDPTDNTIIYGESQHGSLFRFDLKTGLSKSIRPEPENPEEIYRFNWNSPILISSHDPKTVYLGGNRLFISKDRGETWQATVDLTTQQHKEKLPLMGVLSDENTLSRDDGIRFYGDITTITESPLKKGLLYVGTDDGNLQVSKDSGKTWKNIIANVPGVPKYTYVSRIVASKHEEGGTFVTFDGHRNDDFNPYVLMTADYGETWTNISGNLPNGGTVNVIREHHRNPDLLFVGTERGGYFSIDRGKKWIKFKNDFPIVPVDDIAIHPRENDLIFGTHGRSIWILDDITPLEQLNEEVFSSLCYLFNIRKATMFTTSFSHVDFFKGQFGHKVFIAPNPPYGAIISYYLKESAKKDVKIAVQDSSGRIIRELQGSGKKGINRTTWDLRYGLPDSISDEQIRSYPAPMVFPGTYQVTLKMADTEMTESVEVEGDPQLDMFFTGRKAHHDALVSIYKLFPALSSAGHASKSIKEKIKETEEILKKTPGIPKDINQQIAYIFEEITEIQARLLGDKEVSTRFSIRGNLLRPYNSMLRYPEAPSQRQLLKIEQNTKALENIIIRINSIIETHIPKLNSILSKNNLPLLIPEKKIKIDWETQ
jgi:photosystem II stability/assembly factor-like uncharacterized protein